MKCDEYKRCIFYENAPVASQFRYKQKDLVFSNPHINMTNEEESTMATLGADISLKKAYNRLKIVQRHIIRLDMMAKLKSPLIDAKRMKWAFYFRLKSEDDNSDYRNILLEGVYIFCS